MTIKARKMENEDSAPENERFEIREIVEADDTEGGKVNVYKTVGIYAKNQLLAQKEMLDKQLVLVNDRIQAIEQAE